MTLANRMRLASVLIALCASCVLHAAPPPDDLIVIENVTLIDVPGGRRANMRVVTRGDRIESLASAGGALPDDAVVINGEGKFLIPGLWDMHVHFTYELDIAQSMPPLFLANGITYVRDTGGLAESVLEWKKWAQAHPQSSPQIFVAGPLLDGVPTVYDGSEEGYPQLAETVASVEQAEAIVDRLAASGVDFIKAYEMLQPEEFLAILQRATQHGLPVAGHVPLGMSVQGASNAGLDSMEHLRNLENACSDEESLILEQSRAMIAQAGDTTGHTIRNQVHAAFRYRAIAELDWPQCAGVLDLLSKNLTRQLPTLALIWSVFKSFHTEAEWQSTFDYLPEPAGSRWLEQSEKMSNLFANDPAGDAQRAAYLAWVERVIAYLAPRDMLLAGTDTPIFFMTPGFSLHRELQSLVEAGMTPMQALQAATLTPARFFGLEKEMGSIDAGKRADLVLLNADPLEDIRNSTSIEAVIRSGHVYDRNALDVLLANAASVKNSSDD